MKAFPLVLCALSLCLGGCVTPHTSDGTVYAASPGKIARMEPRDCPLKVGMSQGDVRGIYGEPLSVVHTAGGEVWNYWFNRREVIWWGSHPRVARLLFDMNGKLKDFIWNE